MTTFLKSEAKTSELWQIKVAAHLTKAKNLFDYDYRVTSLSKILQILKVWNR